MCKLEFPESHSGPGKRLISDGPSPRAVVTTLARHQIITPFIALAGSLPPEAWKGGRGDVTVAKDWYRGAFSPDTP